MRLSTGRERAAADRTKPTRHLAVQLQPAGKYHGIEYLDEPELGLKGATFCGERYTTAPGPLDAHYPTHPVLVERTASALPDTMRCLRCWPERHEP